MRVRFLGQEDHLEEEMATSSSIRAGKHPSPWGHKGLDMTEHFHSPLILVIEIQMIWCSLDYKMFL